MDPRRGRSAPSRSCLVALQESGSKPPFFCVHGGDGEVMIFQDLARSMGRDRPFYGLQAAGLHEPEIPLGSVETMAARYIEEVRRVRPQGPYFVGGFCLGAFIALEIAIQLRADNQEVGLLAVINTDAAWRDANSTFAGLRRHWRHLLRLPLGQKLKYLRGRAGYRVFRIRSGIQEACYRTWALSGRDSADTASPAPRPGDVSSRGPRLHARYIFGQDHLLSWCRRAGGEAGRLLEQDCAGRNRGPLGSRRRPGRSETTGCSDPGRTAAPGDRCWGLESCLHFLCS